MTTFIGKRVGVSIGGEPPRRRPDEIVGSETIVHLSEQEASKYDRIVGEEISVTVDTGIDNPVRQILAEIQKTDSMQKTEIISLSQQILSTHEKTSKLYLVERLISVSANVAQIASFVVQLKTAVHG